MRAGKQRAIESLETEKECEECSRCALCVEPVEAVAARPTLGQPQRGRKRRENGSGQQQETSQNRQRRGQRWVWHGGTPEAGIGSSSRWQGYKYTYEPGLQTPSGTAALSPSHPRQSTLVPSVISQPSTSDFDHHDALDTPLAAHVRSRSRANRSLPLFLTSLLSFLPFASARPPPTRTAPNPKRTLATEAPAPPPSGVLPTSITPVKETALPYRLEYSEDQQEWVPVEGWVKYGRGFDRVSGQVQGTERGR